MRGFDPTGPRAMRVMVGAVACAALLAACEKQTDTEPRARPPPSAPATDLRVQVEQDLVTVRARDANLRDIIERIAAANRLKLITQDSLDEPVTVELLAEPLVPALRKLLRGRGFVLQHAPDRADTAYHGTLWVFSKESDGVPRTTTEGDPETIDNLTAALEHDDANVRMDAASDLALSENQAAESALTTIALQDPDPNVRAEALYALGSLHADARNPAFKQALTDANRDIRKAAIRALEELRTEDAVEALRPALNDPDASVRAAAADAVGEIGGDAASRVLQQAKRDENSVVREAAEASEE